MRVAFEDFYLLMTILKFPLSLSISAKRKHSLSAMDALLVEMCQTKFQEKVLLSHAERANVKAAERTWESEINVYGGIPKSLNNE